MVRPRKISQQQLDALLGFMEEHRDLALNRFINHPQGHAAANRLWVRLAAKLNGIGNGVTKNPKQWKNYWNELKYKAKKKAATLRTHARGTGGGPSGGKLNETEKRITEIISNVAIEGNSEVQLPLPPLMESELSADLPLEDIPDEDYHVVFQIVDQQPEQSNENSNEASEINELNESSQQPQTSEPREDEQPAQPRTRNRAALMPSWAIEMEQDRMADARRHTAAIEQISSTLTGILEQLTQLVNHFSGTPL